MDEYSKGADDHQQWPQWVPYDWFIHRNINNTLHTPLVFSSFPNMFFNLFFYTYN